MVRAIEKKGEVTGRVVATIFLGFFAVVFAVNAYFMSMALSTHAGVVANEPYRKGLKYNERIAASQQQAALGWKDEISLTEHGRSIVVTLSDAGGHPVRGLDVSAAIGRAATVREDIVLRMSETQAGRYEAALTLAGEGGYVATVEARRALAANAEVVYRARSRLWLKH